MQHEDTVDANMSLKQTVAQYISLASLLSTEVVTFLLVCHISKSHTVHHQ